MMKEDKAILFFSTEAEGWDDISIENISRMNIPPPDIVITGKVSVQRPAEKL